jgi:hypothetical protein
MIYKPWGVLLLAGAVAAVVLATRGDDPSRSPSQPREVVIAASKRTTAAEPSRVATSIRGQAFEYELRGRLDLRRGYRFCGRAAIISDNLSDRGTALWVAGHRGSLAGRSHTYDHVARFSDVTRTPRLTWNRALHCKRGNWIDDHPPILPLPARNASAASNIGAESYLHLALLALTRAGKGTASATRLGRAAHDHGRYRIVFDYRRFDIKPPVRDEDTWEVRPLLRAARQLPIDVWIDSAGYLHRLRFALPPPIGRDSMAKAPVTVDMKLLAIEDVPLAVELRDGDPVSELSQAGEAATSGAAVAVDV